jgi:hypothetical protein
VDLLVSIELLGDCNRIDEGEIIRALHGRLWGEVPGGNRERGSNSPVFSLSSKFHNEVVRIRVLRKRLKVEE